MHDQLVDRVIPDVPNLARFDLNDLSQVCLQRLSAAANPTQQSILFKKLFSDGLDLSTREAESALTPLDLGHLLLSGLLSEGSGRIRSNFQIQVYAGRVFLSDFFSNENDPDFVLPVGPAGQYLANLTIRRPVRSTLDLGCGCGIQSVLAAAHSDWVTATDINPRAVALTRFNADLNGITNLDVLEGSYFEPVAGKKFDLILANLPYVITPDSRFMYRDTTAADDGNLRDRLREIPAHLEEGGIAQVLLHWIIREAQPWVQPVGEYVKDIPLDVWLIYNGSKTPEEYASIWIDRETKKDPALFESTRRDWVRWYRSRGIQRIGMGVVSLRRREAQKNWLRAIPVKTALDGPVGDQFARLFAAQDFLDGLASPRDLLDVPLKKINLEILAGDGEGCKVVSGKEMRFEASLNPATMPVLAYLDGVTPLSTAFDACADGGENTAEILSDIEMLIQLGMLAPSFT